MMSFSLHLSALGTGFVSATICILRFPLSSHKQRFPLLKLLSPLLANSILLSPSPSFSSLSFLHHTWVQLCVLLMRLSLRLTIRTFPLLSGRLLLVLSIKSGILSLTSLPPYNSIYSINYSNLASPCPAATILLSTAGSFISFEIKASPDTDKRYILVSQTETFCGWATDFACKKS